MQVEDVAMCLQFVQYLLTPNLTLVGTIILDSTKTKERCHYNLTCDWLFYKDQFSFQHKPLDYPPKRFGNS